MRRYIKCSLLLLALLLVLAGCGKQADEASATLWVVTEKTASGGMNEQVRQVIAAFEEEHPDFTVQLDILPEEESERELTLQKLRSQIIAGNGPDILLLPTCNTKVFLGKTWNVDENTTISRNQEMLLADPIQSMRTGIFLDISAFYDNDETLGKEALQQTIMDAGTLGDARYILPLRYDFPAVYIYEDGVEALGIDPDTLEEGIIPLLEAVLAAGSEQLASGAEPDFCRTGGIFSLLPAAVDYDTGAATLEGEELAEFLTLYQEVVALAAGNQQGRNTPQIWDYISPTEAVPYYDKYGYLNLYYIPTDAYPSTIPATVSTLSKSLYAAGISKSEGGGYRMAPLRGMDGQLTAWVTYYGAITAGCDYPEEAYDFLRRFLLEENQWEQNRSLQEDIDYSQVKYQRRLIEDGWPVRYKGFSEGIWYYLRNNAFTGGTDIEEKTRARRIQKSTVTDADIPLLDAEIDRVYFGNAVEPEIAEYIRGMNGDDTGEALGTDHIEAAEEFVRALEWNLLEG